MTSNILNWIIFWGAGQAAVAHIFAKKLKSLDISYPKPTEEHTKELEQARELLEKEK
jgi:hypothetical protein